MYPEGNRRKSNAMNLAKAALSEVVNNKADPTGIVAKVVKDARYAVLSEDDHHKAELAKGIALMLEHGPHVKDFDAELLAEIEAAKSAF